MSLTTVDGSLISSGAITLTTQVTGTLPEANGGTGVTTAIDYGFKNRIINGGMVIDQRNAGASVTVNSNSDFYAVDRFAASGESADGVFTVQQSSTAPTGFTKSLLATVTTADASIGATQRYFVDHKIEGFNVADFGFGSASAQTVTLSFWVRSSVTGTFGGTFGNPSGARYNPFSYTINAANTFEQKTITIVGDTSGTWNTTNGTGFEILFSLGCGSSRKGTAGTWTSSVFLAPTGSVDLISTNGATFYITGVQLEKGSTATSFDYRPYGTELSLCQRYYEKSYDIGTVPGASTSSGAAFGGGLNGGAPSSSPMAVVTYKVSKRSATTVLLYDAGGNSGKATTWTSGVSTNNVTASAWVSGENGFLAYINSPVTAGILFQWTINAEL